MPLPLYYMAIVMPIASSRASCGHDSALRHFCFIYATALRDDDFMPTRHLIYAYVADVSLLSLWIHISPLIYAYRCHYVMSIAFVVCCSTVHTFTLALFHIDTLLVFATLRHMPRCLICLIIPGRDFHCLPRRRDFEFSLTRAQSAPLAACQSF